MPLSPLVSLIQHCISWVCCHPVECTATRIISWRWCVWPPRRALPKSGCMPFSTGAIPRHAVPVLQLKKCRTVWTSSRMPPLPACVAVIMQWIATSDGTGLKKPGICWLAVRRHSITAMLELRFNQPMRVMKVMSLSARRSSALMRG